MALTRRSRLRKLVIWTLSILAAVVVGGVVAAYQYVTEGDSLVDLLRREAPRYLPRSRVDLFRARIKPFAGEVMLHNLTLGERAADGTERGIGPGGPASLAYLPSIHLRYDPWAMLHGRFEPTAVVVQRPTIRLRRRDDGTWNCEGLLADPWPGPRGGAMPPIEIHEGVVELIAGPDGTGLKVLTDVEVTIPAIEAGAPVPFELAAKGDLFERVEVKGTVDPVSGRVACERGEVVRLNLSDSLRTRLPAEVGAALGRFGPTAGEVDATWSSLVYEPTDPEPIRIQGSACLRRGIWQCERLPFPISDVSIDLEIRDREVIVTSAKGTDGATALTVQGRLVLGDPASTPFEVVAHADGLHLDNRLRDKTPSKFLDIWDLYFPEVARSRDASAGRINLTVRAGRRSVGAAVECDADIDLVDVAMQYRHFPYRVEHVQGRMHLTPARLILSDVHTTVGNRPLVVNGTVDDPGPNATARLRFVAEALPVDDPLFLRALPPDVRKVVNDFRPTGTVRGVADLLRRPATRPGDDPRGPVTFDAQIDLNPGCSATWTGLKYPVRELTGHLEVHPNRWVFEGMRGSNGQATIQVDGQVEQVRRNEFRVGLTVRAENLPFDHQLRDALPRPWQKAWTTLNPTGASDFVATVRAEPGQHDHTQIQIWPRPQTGVTLRFDPIAAPGLPAPTPLALRMDDVSGQFVYDTAKSPPTTMTDVAFKFRGADVKFRRGEVDVKDSGEFALGVAQLQVKDLRLDEPLRRMMPPVMGAFARRLDGRVLPTIRADLGLGWSGRPGESAWCRWKDGLVVLANNRLEIGGQDIALDHVEGQLDQLQGSFDGTKLALTGDIDLASVALQGQQMTHVVAQMFVRDGRAGVNLTQGTLLGGAVAGRVESTLEATPQYAIELAVDNAELQEYAKTLPGHQTFRGRVSGRAKVSGSGYEMRSLTGSGSANVADADLGTLPPFLRPLAVLKQADNAKTAFDTAEVVARIDNGETTLKPIRLIGETISLEGGGTLDVHGVLNLKLELLPGRDRGRFPRANDLARELGGLIGAFRVVGSIGAPVIRFDPVPLVGASLRSQGRFWSGIRTAPADPTIIPPRPADPPPRAGPTIR